MTQPTPIFQGVKTNGKWQTINRDAINRYIKSLRNGKYNITIKQAKKKKSDPLRRYYFGVVLPMIGDEIGEYDKDSLHHSMKEMFASTHHPDIPGLKIIELFRKMETPRRLEYIEQVKIWAAEFLNIYIPDPNETEMREVL